MRLRTKCWTGFVCLCVALLTQGRSLAAQTTNSSDPQSNCVDSLLTPCNPSTPQAPPPGSTSAYSNQYQPSTGAPESQEDQADQRTRDFRDDLYIDSAGVERNRQTGLRENRDRLFPPDPVTDMQRLAKSAIGEMLPVFGRDLFRNVPSTFAPGDQLAVTPDYIIGPGDDVLLRLWGPQSFNSQLTVDRSGSIYIPKVGAIHVAGLRFDELQKQVTTALSRTYRNFNVSVNLGRLRSIQVYVVGEARRPGAYTVSSLSTVLNALFASGGPDVQGSLRHIQVRRAGQTLPEFDLYDVVLRGDKSKDVQLETGDTIFIPAVGPQVAFGGSVRHPAIYELGKETSLQQLLSLAGGLSPTASTTQISLERIGDNQTRHAMTVALDPSGRLTELRDGDVLYAGHITAGYEQSVTIRGNLANPGRFAWHEGMRLSDIIPDRSSLLTTDYWRARNRLGVPVPLFEPLQQNPTYRRTPPNLLRPNGSRGDVTNAGRPVYGDQGYGNQDYGDQAYGDQGYGSNGTTQDQADTQTEDLQQAYPGQSNNALVAGALANRGLDNGTDNNGYDYGNQGNVSAAPGTLSQPQSQQGQRSGTEGQPAKPKNKIAIPAPEIDWAYAVIERLDPDTLKSSLVPFNLGKLVEDHDPLQNLSLHPGDIVTILSQNDILVPQDEQTKYIRLEGEFMASGVYSVKPNETLEEVVRRAGGLTPKAYLYGSAFQRESARVFQQQRLDEYISSLSADMEREAAVRTASSTSGILDPNALAEQRSLISQLRALRATGRVVLEFRPGSAGVASIPAIPLENGDVFRVPTRPNTVSVIGAVYGQNVFLYNPDRRLENYIALAGNPNRIADQKHAFIIRADGSIFSRERAKGVLSNQFDNARINPGDAIVIPEKLVKPTALRELIDYSQILSSFGLAAAAINVVR